MGARGDCVPRHGVVARAWLAGCLRATSGNTADTAWQYCPGSRSDTPPRQALVRLGSERRRSPFRCVATFVMPRCEPIPALEHRPRISESHRGKLDRFLLATLIRYRARLQHRDITVPRGCRTHKSGPHVATRLGERGPSARARPARRSVSARTRSRDTSAYGAPDARCFALSLATERISENSGRVRGGAAIDVDRKPTKSETYSGGD